MKYLFLFFAFLLFGCSSGVQHPTTPIETVDSTYEVKYLFTVDSCDVYSFYYGGYTRTLCICPNRQISEGVYSQYNPSTKTSIIRRNSTETVYK